MPAHTEPDPTTLSQPHSQTTQLALRIVRLTRVSDAGVGLLVCSVAVFVLGPIVAEVFLEIDLDANAWAVAFVGFALLFTCGAVASVGAWLMARRRFASAEWTQAVAAARAGAGGNAGTATGGNAGPCSDGALRSGAAMAAGGGATAVVGHVASSAAPDDSPAEALGDAATLAGAAVSLFGLTRWNRAAREVAREVAAAEGAEAGAQAATHWRAKGRALWLVPSLAYLLALVLAVGALAWDNASANASAAAVLDEAVAALEGTDGVGLAYSSGDEGVSSGGEWYVVAHLEDSDSYVRVQTDETGSITKLSFHLESAEGWTDAEVALDEAASDLALLVAAVRATSLADPLGLLDAATLSETLPELVASLDLASDYDHASQTSQTADGVEVSESASTSDGELEFYLTLSAE